MKYRITLPTKKELDLHKSCISVSFQNSKIIEAKPIKELNPSEKIIEDERHWFLRCDSKTNSEFPKIINKIFLKKIDNNLLKNE